MKKQKKIKPYGKADIRPKVCIYYFRIHLITFITSDPCKQAGEKGACLLFSPCLPNHFSSATARAFKVELVLRSLERQRTKRILNGGVAVGKDSPLQPPPLGRFLCPVCNCAQLIERRGIAVIPVNIPVEHSMLRCQLRPGCPVPRLNECDRHGTACDMFCFTCSLQESHRLTALYCYLLCRNATSRSDLTRSRVALESFLYATPP